MTLKARIKKLEDDMEILKLAVELYQEYQDHIETAILLTGTQRELKELQKYIRKDQARR